MKRRYVYINICLTLTALLLPCPFLKFGKYTAGQYTSIRSSESIAPRFPYLVPSFDELEIYLKDFAKNYSYFATLYELGRTITRGNEGGVPIYNMVLSSGYAKPIIIVVGGIYASDLASPLTVIHCLTEWTTNTKVLAQLLPLYDFHFIPVLNPEGYEFVYGKKVKGEDFAWLKNMNGYTTGDAVNILNNFDNHFNEIRRSVQDEHYGGSEPFSETESKIFRDYIITIQDHIAGVFLLFSTPKDDAITYPYAHTMDKHDLWILQDQLAIHAIRASRNISYDSIAIVSSAEYCGLESGRMDDWLLDTLHTSIVLNIQFNYVLKVNDNYDSLNSLHTKTRVLLKQLVLGSYSERYLKFQERPPELREELYRFPWKTIT